MRKDNKFFVEIDVDGVLANMDGSYAKYVNHIIPGFNEEEHIKDWGMPDIKEQYPEVYDIIRSLYVNPEFIRTLPRYEGIEKYLQEIYRVTSQNNGKIVIHTHILSKECAKEREKWLKVLKRDTKVNFEIDICVGSKKKTRDNSLIVIEDNVNNLKQSSASYKFLMRRGHNRFFTLEDVGEYEKGFIIKDLSKVAGLIEELVTSDRKEVNLGANVWT